MPGAWYRSDFQEAAVRYADFRDRLEAALLAEGVLVPGADRRVETIDLADTVRSWEANVYRAARDDTKPFDVSAAIGFHWSPVDAARAYTSEEDFLAEVVGRRKRSPRTARRWTRVDLRLHANLPYGSTTSIPEPSVFGAWTADAVARFDAAFTDVEERDGRIVAVRGGHGGLELQARCNPDGIASLSAVTIAGFRIVRVPRVWDSPERRTAEADSHSQLTRLAQTFKTALAAWVESISALAAWVRHSPPLPGAQPAEPWSDNESEDDDGGPDILH
jgi:hypothetical protein